MGVLWNDGTRTNALASFENGIVYKGDGFFREQIGTYTSDRVYDLFGNEVAKFNGNTAYNPLFLSIEGYCTFDSNRIYKGGSTWNDTIATYDGDPYGACAAAVLYFGLHHGDEQKESAIHDLPSNGRNGSAGGTYSGNGTGAGSVGGEIFGAIVIILVCLAAGFAFYFTEWGHNMVFGEETGRQVFFICMAVSIVSGIIIYRSKSIIGFSEIAGGVLGSHLITYLIVVVIALIDAGNQGKLSFGMVLMLLIGGVIGTIGVASLFCVIEIPILCIVKYIKRKTNK